VESSQESVSKKPFPLKERAAASVAAFRCSRAETRALRDHAFALRQIGEMLSQAADAPAASLADLQREVLQKRSRCDELAGFIGRSLDEDRTDYAEVSALYRPLVILRGLAQREILRSRLRKARKELSVAWERLGGQALDDASLTVPAAELARAARAAASRARDERVQLLAPYGGAALPPAMTHGAREAQHLGKSIFQQARGSLVPRAPAVAGMGVGWWIANTFTDSSFSATLHSMGLGGGPRYAVTTEQYQLMHFWLPIVAAAACSYLGNRLAALIRHRYQPGSAATK
jgi:hypothetical protein